MQLGFFKIFALSKNKRLFNVKEPNRTIGIYDVEKFNYPKAKKLSLALNARVSVLLGEVIQGVKLMCLDLDDCIIPSSGELEPDTIEFLKEFDRDEWEFSSSGEGIHIYILTKQDFDTFIIKDMEGCKSFECYTNKRHIVTTSFDFIHTSLEVGKHDVFLLNLYKKAEEKRNIPTFKDDVKNIFEGKEINSEQDFNSVIYDRPPVTDMYTLRGKGYKDSNLIDIIDTDPSTVDQSAHDAKLIRKLMYYTLSFDSAWELAKKTNYYKHKDKKHILKFNNPTYKERTRRFIENGYVRKPYQGGHI